MFLTLTDTDAQASASSQKIFLSLSIFARLNRHIHRERKGKQQEANMTIQLTTAQALKSFAGTAIFALGLDAASLVSRHTTDAAWFVLRELASVLFWGVLAGWHSSQQIF
ncbi:MAG TPA: hypothetical protein VKB24_09800, partial [Candidatus Acidoferrum sp.]|nr:hypothetical protein [Candidatus Acidoferrum sp.]